MTSLRRWRNQSCPDDGSLRNAVANGVDRDPEITEHLRACERCRWRFELISRDASMADQKLEVLGHDEVNPDVRLAYQKLRGRVSNGGTRESAPHGSEKLMDRIWNQRALRGAAALTALVVLMAAFALTPMRSLADSLFNRFEVEEFRAVTIRPDDFGAFQVELLMRGLGSDMERVFAAMENLAEIETSFDTDDPRHGAQEFSSAADAAAVYGVFREPGNVPSGFEQSPRYLVSEPGWVRLNANTESVNIILEELRFDFASVPNAADLPIMTFEVNIPQAVVTWYEAGEEHHLAIVQMQSPTITTPEGVDMNALRNDVLSLPGLPVDFVNQMRAIDDWQRTLIVPVPEGARTSDVMVDGQPALLIEAGEVDGSSWGVDIALEGDLSIVMWEDDGVLYLVAGTLNRNDVLDVARSLR